MRFGVALLVVVVGCGRVGFNLTASDALDGDDTTLVDAENEDGVTRIYRSIGPGRTTPLAAGAGAASVSITSGIATFESGVPDNVGIGDTLAAAGTIVFVHQRINAAQFVVRTARGLVPADIGSTGFWALHRAYTDSQQAISGLENTGIEVAVRDFDVGPHDLVGANEQWNFAVYGDGAAGAMRILGWASDPTHYLRIFAPHSPGEVGISQRHDGVWDPTKARFVSDDYFGTINNENETNPMNDVRIEGLQIENTRSIGPAEGSGINFDDFDMGTMPRGEVHISHCLIRKSGPLLPGIEHAAIWINGPQLARIVLYNNVFVGFSYGIAHAAVDNLALEIYNNTVLDAATGGISINANAANETIRIKNNLVVGSPQAFSIGTGITTADYASNLSDDASAPGAGSMVNATVTFVDRAGGNYRLTTGDTDAINTATDLSTGPFPFTTDIVGQPRGAQWEIGAFAF